MPGFLILILIFGAIWLLFVMPARRRKMSHAAMQNTVAAGDDVITSGGIHGKVREVTDDLVHLEIAAGVVVEVDRRAIAAVAREVEVEVEPDPESETETGTEPEPVPDEPVDGATEEPS